MHQELNRGIWCRKASAEMHSWVNMKYCHPLVRVWSGLLTKQVVIHNERDGVCARQTLVCSQGDISENGQRCIQLCWSAETVGYSSNTMIANDWVTYGWASIWSLLNVQSVLCKSVTTGTSIALCDQVNWKLKLGKHRGVDKYQHGYTAIFDLDVYLHLCQ